MELFPSEKISLALPDAAIDYFPEFFDLEKANLLFQTLMKETQWQQDTITLFNKTHLQPRLTALYGNHGKPYTYSGITMRPHPWNAVLTFIKEAVEQKCETQFSSVLLNLYRNGSDSMGWHSDNERELGKNPVIASLSFGAERVFQMKHNTIKEAKQNLILKHGSLLIMAGTMQHFWKHQVPKTQQNVGPRINLTFRKLD